MSGGSRRAAGAASRPCPWAVVLVVLAAGASQSFATDPDQDSFPLNPGPPDRFQWRWPIRIESDADFKRPDSGVTGGQGTADDPYVIAGWRIMPLDGFGIWISNTTAHVVIRNVMVHEGDKLPKELCTFTGLQPKCYQVDPRPQVGVVLWNVTAVRVETSFLLGNTHGVVASQVQQLGVVGNHISHARSSRLSGTALGAYDDAVAVVHSLTWPARLPVYGFVGLLLLVHHVNPMGVVAWSNGHVEIRENTIWGIRARMPFQGTAIAVDVHYANLVEIEDNVLFDNDFTVFLSRAAFSLSGNALSGGGVTLHPGSAGSVENNEFKGSRVLICGVGTEVVVKSNQFVNSSLSVWAANPYCPNDALAPAIERNTFSDGGELWMSGSLRTTGAGIVRNNRFERMGSAIFLQDYPARLLDNTILDSRIGIQARASAAFISGNVIQGNDYGVVAYWDKKPVLQDNVIAENKLYAVHNTDQPRFDPDNPPGTLPVDARWNWWGSASGPPAEGENGLYGAVIHQPWRIEPP